MHHAVLAECADHAHRADVLALGVRAWPVVTGQIADQDVGAHVAQQAARLARARKLERSDRRRLLAAAWLHDTGPAELGSHASLVAARRLRAAGMEDLARIVAHCGGAPMAAALAEHPPVVREFPVPGEGDAALLTLLDVAIITTRPDGAPGKPLDALRDRMQQVPAGDPGVRALVAL